MKTYIVHYEKLKDRKSKLVETVKRHGLNDEWLIQKGYYDQSFLSSYYEYDVNEWKRKVRIAKRPLIYRPLTKSEVHLAVNHFLIGEKILLNDEAYSLVLEDDAVLVDEFIEKLDCILKSKKDTDWDILYLDYLGGKVPEVNSLTITDKRADYEYYGTCAYLIKKDAWRRMLGMEEKITLPIDEEFKYRINYLGLKAYWAIPPLVSQASKHKSNGSSSLDERDKVGLKKYIIWRKHIYKHLPKRARKAFESFEMVIKKLILGIS